MFQIRSRAIRCFVEKNALEESMARDFERQVYNWAIRRARDLHIPQTWSHTRFRDLYSQKCMSMFFNIDHPKNSSLRTRLLSGQVTPRWCVHAHPRELFPELWEEVYERVAYKAMRKILSSDATTAPDGAFQCRACKSRKTVFTQV